MDNESTPEKPIETKGATAAATEPVNGQSPNGASKPLTPPVLAHQLFEAALAQCKGNPGEASMQVIRFFSEAIVFTISVSAADNEVARRGLLKHVGETIMSAPLHPLIARNFKQP